MEDLFKKYKDALQTNENLTIENQKLKTQNTLLQEELNLLKNDMDPLFKNYLIQTKKYVLGLLGYEIDIKDDCVELLSLYAFDRNDKIVFQIVNKNVNLMSNEFTDEYNELIDTYLVKGKSIPAFLSSVTLDLWGKKTFQ